MSDFVRLLGYVRPYRGRLLAAVGASVLAAGFTVALPVLVRPLVDQELGAAPDLVPRLSAVAWLHGPSLYGLIVLAFFGKGLFSYLSQYLMSWVGERAVCDLRTALGRALAHQSVGFFSERPAGGLLSRVTSDAEKVLIALSEKLYDLIREPLSMLALAGYLFWVEWPLAVVSLVLAPLVMLPIARFRRRLRRASERSSQGVADLASRLNEVIRGIRVIKASSTEDLEAARISRVARAIFASNLRAVKVVALTPPLMELLAGFGIAAAFFYGRMRIAEGAMSPGELLSFMTALFMLYTPAKKLSRVQVAFEQALASARRCFAVLDVPIEVLEREGAVDLDRVKGEVRFEGVSFRYHEPWVLRDLDLELEAGQVTALVGRSGAGKTTIANLILRFHDPSVGRVTVDGRDLRDVSLRSLRRQIALVPQDVVLFNDTLRANIAYGLDGVAFERVEAAARAAFAHEFIVAQPEGYDTVVGEGGAKLSTGQRQRIAIARALLKDAPILLLDEATSALDAESESLVVQALSNLMTGRTSLVIAHRLSTVRRADRILVIEDGRIHESGTHDQLMARVGGLYNRLAELQAVGEIVE